MTEDQLRYYVDYLQSEGYVAEAEGAQIKISVVIEGISLVLKCVLSRFFPYKIPEIYLEDESSKALPKMPHLHTDNSICVFDKNKVIPNFNAPQELLLDTITTAISVIKNGILEKSSCDFIDEFLEYWSAKGLLDAQMFVEKLDIAQHVYWCGKKKNIIITENIENLERISYAIDGKSIEKCRKGFLIPIDGTCIKEIPKTDTDIIKLIEKYSSFYEQYNLFMQKNIKNPCLIIFNIIKPEGNMLAGWIHPGPGVPKGFRKGHVNIKAAFSMAKERGVAVSIENCHQNRLFTRGGDGKKTVWNKAAVIGCGSIGSFIVDALKFYGLGQFVLVDNEMLQYENIARHTGGYFSVGTSKVRGLDFWLSKHNPNIVCETYEEDAHVFIEDKTEVINSCDIIFVAVASVPVEHHINRLILENRITSPVVIIWVEPYLVGGHAIVIKKKQNLYKEVFDPYSLEYKNSIIQNGGGYLKREAGCQSTYMPYSGFLLQQFIYRIIDHITSNCWTQKGNYLLTWCGKLHEAEKHGMKINEEYKDFEDYSLITRRID